MGQEDIWALFIQCVLFPYSCQYVFFFNALSSLYKVDVLIWVGAGAWRREALVTSYFIKLFPFSRVGFPGMWPAKNACPGPDCSFCLRKWFQRSFQTLQPGGAADDSRRHEPGPTGECLVLPMLHRRFAPTYCSLSFFRL